jgi:single-stranded-DNA-specific exonuclease
MESRQKEGTVFLCQPIADVLMARGIEDVDSFLEQPFVESSPRSFSIPSMEKAAARVLCAIRGGERITIFGDYDCDGVLGAHILRSVLSGLGAPARTSLPDRDEGYGLSSPTVHRFSCSGTDLLITVDNGINARAAVRLAQRLGIDIVVIDHHRTCHRFSCSCSAFGLREPCTSLCFGESCVILMRLSCL